MKVTVDARQLSAFGKDLAAHGDKVSKKIEPVVFKGAMNIKKRMRKDMEASRHFKPVARTIDFDITAVPSGVRAEIGPSKKGRSDPGSLANIAYFGGSRGGGGTVDVTAGLREEEPRFLRELEKIAGEL